MTGTKRICSIPDCETKVVARGLCSMHWQRFMRHGDPLIVIPSIGSPPVDPWTRIEKRGPDDCWPWTHTVDRDGYGRQKINGTTWIVPRWVLTQKVGPLADNEVTRHTCDNRICCNPAHLVRGYPVDNVNDMISRKRHIHGKDHWTAKDATKVQGMNNGEAKLTDDQVREIRRLYATGDRTQVSLGEEFGVCQTRISSIVLRKTWKSVA